MANAQIGKGATALGLNLAATYNINKLSSPGSFNSSNNELTKTTKVFAAQPLAEFFIGKNLSFGIGFNYGIILTNEKLSLGTNFNSLDNSLYTYGLQIQLKNIGLLPIELHLLLLLLWLLLIMKVLMLNLIILV